MLRVLCLVVQLGVHRWLEDAALRVGHPELLCGDVPGPHVCHEADQVVS